VVCAQIVELKIPSIANAVGTRLPGLIPFSIILSFVQSQSRALPSAEQGGCHRTTVAPKRGNTPILRLLQQFRWGSCPGKSESAVLNVDKTSPPALSRRLSGSNAGFRTFRRQIRIGKRSPAGYKEAAVITSDPIIVPLNRRPNE
jgi:hypothetical protein